MAKGQLSLELLLVFLIFLSLLSIAYVAVDRLAMGARERINKELAESFISDFASKLDSACCLGNGNVRIADANGGINAEISGAGRALEIKIGNISKTINSSCELEVVSSGPSNSFLIENKEGTIVISSRTDIRQ